VDQRLAWIADLRQRHRPETVLTLLQLQALGPGLYTSKELLELLGMSESSIQQSFARLQCTGLLRYEGWPKKGRLIWWVADWDNMQPDPATQFPRWVLRANAVRQVEVLLGKEREAADRLRVNWKSLSNFLSRRTGCYRLLGEWSIELDPVQFVTR
jgi:hypothetical protein